MFIQQFIIVKQLCYRQRFNMSQVTLQSSLSAARPLLLHVDQLTHSFPKTTFILYYRNYLHQDEQVYKPLADVKELFLPHEQLEFKIINFQKQTAPLIVKSHSLQKQGSKVIISTVRPQGTITIVGTILNQSSSEDAVIDFSLLSKNGYDEFYKYRKKYKTLQNLTRKLEFQLDHRITVKLAGRECRFDLQQKKKERYFLNRLEIGQQISIVLEESVSIQDVVLSNVIDEVQIDITELRQRQNSYTVKVRYNDMFEVIFLLDLVKNQNLAASDLVSIRLFQTSTAVKSVRIGTEQSLHLSGCIKLQPLMNGRIFDYEWGYLNENLNKVDVQEGIYSHLDKITQSLPHYPHFINQQIINLKDCNSLIFEAEGQLVKIPLIYVLKGFNFVQSNKIKIKFYIDSQRGSSSSKGMQIESDRKKIYQLSIQQIWNISKIHPLLDRANCNAFQLKMVTQDTTYFIPFQRTIVGRNQFRKEAKDLDTRTEVIQKADSKYVSLQNCPKGKQQLYAIQTTAINPFYIVHTTSSSALSFQIIISGTIALEGTLSKAKLYETASSCLTHMLTSVQGDCKVGLVLNLMQIKQDNDSAATYYNFKHRLYFAQAAETQQILYDIAIQFQKQSKHATLRSKISPESKRQLKDGIFLKDFPNVSGVFTKQERLFFTVKIRKMFYNDALNYFDNQVLMSKTVAINPSADILKQDNNIVLQIQKQTYRGVEFDLYDSNIQKRIKYYLQIYAEKNEFLDYKDSSYKIKIPNVLWNFTNGFRKEQEQSSYEITAHLNRKNKNIDKFSFADNFQQEIILDHYNYKDGISLTHAGQIGYSKFIKCIKLRGEVVKEKIGWSFQSDWYFAVISLAEGNFYFMVQRMFDPYEEKKKDSDGASSRTVSRDNSTKSDKMKIDPLAKTINNMDLFKLKKKKNELVAEGRQLTARYVKRQEQILKLNKKLEELEEQISKRRQEQVETKQVTRRPNKETVRLKEFYRSICECGDRNPEFNGYCQSCLKKIKTRYEIYSKQYSEKSCEYQKLVFEKYNQKQKIQRIKRKIEGYRNHTETIDSQHPDETSYLIRNMEEKAIRKTLEDLKIEVFEMEEQKHSLLETSKWQMRALEAKIAEQDQMIYKNSQQYDSLQNRLKELRQLYKTSTVESSSHAD